MFNANLINSFVKIIICGLQGSGVSHVKRQPSKEYGNGLKYSVLSAVKTLTEMCNDRLKLTCSESCNNQN